MQKKNEMLPSRFILGTKVHPLTLAQLHQAIEGIIKRSSKAIVANVNVHALNLAYKRPWLREFFNTSEIVFCDGAGVILGGKLLGFDIPERITYADWMWQFAAFANPRKYSFYFLGAKEGIAERAAERLLEKSPDIRILGIHHGYFNQEKSSEENQEIIAKINRVKPDVLVLGLGMPLQEKWLLENWGDIDAKIALTGGAVFDYVSGELQRGPRWLTDHGFEWLARLFIEPKRLWKRYVVGNPLFLWRVMLEKLGIIKISE